MSRKKAPQVKEDVTCNLIPMIDIMFLLLLFFMLSADMGQREFEDVLLPQADQVKEDAKERGNEVTTTVNVFHRQKLGNFSCALYDNNQMCRDPEHWLFAVRGKEYTLATVGDQLKVEAEQVMEPDIDPDAGKVLSALKVNIRADERAPYGHVNKIIELCGKASIYKIEVGAAQPPKA